MVHIETVYEVQSEPAIVHCSTIIRMRNGDLLCAWYQGSYETSSDTVLKISRRNGDGSGGIDVGKAGQWSDPIVLFDFRGAPLGNPVLWRPPEGSPGGRSTSGDQSVYITFSVLTAEDWKSSLLFYSRSDDEGRTWTSPALFLSSPGFMSKTKPVSPADGSVLFPLYHEGEYCPYVMRINDFSSPMSSSLVAETMARRKAIQPALFNIDGQRILMMCRTNQGTVWRSVSYNEGYSWSILRPTNLPNPDSAVDLFAATNDRIGIVYNPSADERNVLALGVSDDDGQSWERRTDVVSGDGEYSYPFTVNLPDGRVAVSFTDSRYAIRVAHVDPAAV